MEPETRWERRKELFTVALMSKLSICVKLLLWEEGKTERRGETATLPSLDILVGETETIFAQSLLLILM